jgi:DNA-binding MarR family transcriptional regulator
MNPELLAEIQESILKLLHTFARHVSGDLTLNQIRVLQFINLCSRYRGEATSNVEVCSELDLPSATVSRAIAKFIEAGLISDEVDPDDGRRRLVVGTGVIPGTNQHLDPELAALTEHMADFTANVPDVESMDQESRAQSQSLMFEMLMTMAAHIGGDLTLNQIRVLQFINLCWRHRSVASTSHMEICTELQLPSATVSRAVARFIETGIVSERVDPDDGRKRLVVGTGVIPGAVTDDLDLVVARLFARRADSQD